MNNFLKNNIIFQDLNDLEQSIKSKLGGTRTNKEETGESMINGEQSLISINLNSLKTNIVAVETKSGLKESRNASFANARQLLPLQ